MPISKNIARAFWQYKERNHRTFRELSEELQIPKSMLQCYIDGRGNPRADTLELIAKKLGVSVTELVSGSPPGWEQAETIVRAAAVVGDLPSERCEECIELFLKLVALFSKEGNY